MQKKLTLKIVYFILTVVIFFVISETVYSQATNCDFWGTATYNGNNVEDGDVIKAYDPQGVHCGTSYYVSGGNYGIHVSGDEPSTSDTDEGATEGDAITFKINGKTASIVSGSNTWTNNGSVECNLSYTAPSHSITIQTNPSGLNFTVDGTAYSSSQVFSWTQGSSHDISVTSPQSGGTGTRYIYSSWSDGGAQSHSYTVGSSDETVTANFTIQYYLTVTSPYGSPTGEGWYNQGVSANFLVTSPDVQGDTRYVFLNWSGDYSGTNSSESITMDAPKTVTANWKTQYKLTVNSSHGNPQGEGWYDAGVNVGFSVTTPDEQGDTKYIFLNWSGDCSSSNPSESLIMDAPKTVTANWKTQYYLTVNSSHGNPQGEGWYDAGVNAGFSVTSPDLQGSTRYIFNNWSGDFSGTSTSGSVTMDEGKIVTANWSTQYYLSTAENPDAGGDISPASPGAWYDAGTDATVDATVNSGYGWGGWTGDLSGTTRPENITMNSPKSVTANFGTEVTITITTAPAGLEYSVDGTVYSNEQNFTWVEDTQHDISVLSPQSGGTGIRYVFTSWNHGKDQSHSYTVPASNQTLTASFNTQYYLTVNSAHGNPQGAGWYNEGINANFSVTSPDEQGDTRYVFLNWSGDCSSTNSSESLLMDEPKTVTANWKAQYYLTVNSSHGNPQGKGWYDAGVDAGFSVTSPDVQGGTRYIFNNWSGDFSGTSTSGSVTMDAGKTVTANWTTQYYLSTAENPDAGGDITPVPPGTWYNAGANASLTVTVSDGYGWLGWTGDLSGTDMSPNITMNSPKSVTANFGKEVNITFTTNPAGLKYSVDGAVYNSEKTFAWIETNTYTITAQSPQNAGSGARYVYNYWSDGGNRSHTYTVPGSDKTVTTHYRKQYTLTVNSVHGNPQGTGWYNENTSADFSVTTPDEQEDTRYVFLNWSGDYSGTNPSGSVTMNTSKSVTAHWKIQYHLTVNSSHGNPQGAGWYDDGSTAEFSVTSPDEVGTIRYIFDSWSGDCTGTNPAGSVTMDAGKNVTALWITQFYLTITANPDVGGNIVVDPAGYWYDKGLTVSITAQPDTGNGYQFTEWSGDLSGSENPEAVAMDTAKNIIANFELQDTKVSDNEKYIVADFNLCQNHPNPFNPETEITYSLPKSAHVTLIVYNMIGQPVRTLVDTNMPAGIHHVIWDSKNDAGQSVPSGIYVYILKSGSYTKMRKALLMK